MNELDCLIRDVLDTQDTTTHYNETDNIKLVGEAIKERNKAIKALKHYISTLSTKSKEWADIEIHWLDAIITCPLCGKEFDWRGNRNDLLFLECSHCSHFLEIFVKESEE